MLDPDATRAAARALYEGQGMPFELTTDEAITAALAAAQRRVPSMAEAARHSRARRVQLPHSPPPPPLDAGQIETILRSAPQICAHCRLLSDAPARTCPSPRGHYFVTDYVAMAEKIRAYL